MHIFLCIRQLCFRDENAPYNLSQARTFLSDIEVVLGQLSITSWGEAVFDYLPNLMYIGGFEGNSSLTFRSALFIVDNNVADIPSSNVTLRQIHFPRLVEIPVGNVTLNDNPDLCFIGKLEFYLTSPNQVVIYDDPINPSAIPRRPYNECGMYVTMHVYLKFSNYAHFLYGYILFFS